MGGAMAEGMLKLDEMAPEELTVCDHNKPVIDHFASLGASVTQDNEAAARDADIVCVVVKPWVVEKTLKGIKDVMDYSRQTLVVVAAGVSSSQIKTWTDKEGNKRRSAEILADSVYFGDYTKSKDNSAGPKAPHTAKPSEKDYEAEEEGELPF